MIQTGLIPSTHNDLVTDASYDFHGLRLATCSIDQRIKIWQLDETNNTWAVADDWKAHDATVSRLSWAHPEFGSILASSSFDRTVKIWELASSPAQSDGQQSATSSSQQQPQSGSTNSRWVERAVLPDARGTVRAVEFAPRHFGLKLATISSDNFLRVYECLEQPSITTWQLCEEIDIQSLPSRASPAVLSRVHTMALATPTQTSATLEGASASLVAQALQQGLQQGSGAGTGVSAGARPGIGNREADGGWCISWCKDRYWGEVIAASCGTNGIVKIIQLSPSRRPATVLTLDPSPTIPDSAPIQGGFSISMAPTSSTNAATANVPTGSMTPSHTQPTFSLTGPGTGLNTGTAGSSGANTGFGASTAFSTSASSSATTAQTSAPFPTSGTSQVHNQPHSTSGTGTNAGSASGPSSTDPDAPRTTWSITSISWAPSCGRSYHLIATGGRDGRVRIWKVRPGEEADVDDGENLGVGVGGLDREGREREGKEENRWTASVVADFDQHKSPVGRVEWNITGTVLSSAGNDSRIRLWKATTGSVWRPAGSIGVEQADEPDRNMQQGEMRDVEMES